jgi:hypothetical protein
VQIALNRADCQADKEREQAGSLQIALIAGFFVRMAKRLSDLAG